MRKLNLAKRAKNDKYTKGVMYTELRTWAIEFLGENNHTDKYLRDVCDAIADRLLTESGDVLNVDNKISRSKAKPFIKYATDAIKAHEFAFKYDKHMADTIALSIRYFVKHRLDVKPTKAKIRKVDRITNEFAGYGFGYARDHRFVLDFRSRTENRLHDIALEQSDVYDKHFWHVLFAVEACACKFMHERSRNGSDLDSVISVVRDAVEAREFDCRADAVAFGWDVVCHEWEMGT